MYRIMAFLPFNTILRSRYSFTREDAEDAILEFPVGFQIVEEQLALEQRNVIEFPIVEESNAGSDKEE